MTAVGGSVEAINIAGREFAATADADINFKLGGFENEVRANGNGTARIIKTRVPSGLSSIVVENDQDRDDHEFVQSVADSNDFVPVAITYASGTTYQGRATVVGELQGSSQSATLSFDMQGEGKFVKQ